MEKKAIKDKRLLKVLLTFKLWKEEAKLPYAFDAWGPWTRKGKKKKKSHIGALIWNLFFFFPSVGTQMGSKSQHLSYFVERLTKCLNFQYTFPL